MDLSPFNRKPGTTIGLPLQMDCPICAKEFRVTGFRRHLRCCLRREGMTEQRYEALYPHVLDGPVHQFARKWLELARFSLNEFGLMDYGGCDYFHVNNHRDRLYFQPRKNGNAKWVRRPESLPLLRLRDDGSVDWTGSLHQFRRHLHGGLTLAIWPDLDNSFLMIDLDHDARCQLDLLVQRLIGLGLEFHIEHSGRKGYHVWLFFDGVIPNHRLIAMHKHLCVGLEVDRGVWPFKRALIKLPLGLHRVTMNVAGFVNYPPSAIPLDRQLDYFLQITPQPVPAMIDSIAPAPPADAPKTERPSQLFSKPADRQPMREWALSNDECGMLLDEGTRPAGLSRELLLFRLAAFLKDTRGADPAECMSALLAWSHCVSTTPRRVLLRDVDRQVRQVFKRNVHHGSLPGLSDRQREIVAAFAERSLAGRELDRQQRQQARATLIRLAECLVRLLLKYQGRSHVSFATLSRMTGVSLKRVQKWLPLICGADLASEGPAYVGSMFKRIETADYRLRRAQEYVLTPEFAAALGLDVMAEECAA